MSVSAAYLLVLSILWRHASAQSSTASFLYPNDKERQIFNHNDVVEIQWVSNYAHRWLLNWCKDAGSNNTYVSDPGIPLGDADTSYQYIINQHRTVWPVFCRPSLTYNESTGKGENIEIKNDLTWTSTSGLPTTWFKGSSVAAAAPATITASVTVTPSASTMTSSTAMISTPSIIASSTSSISAAPTASGSENSGLSSGAKAGLGVGVTLGILAFIAVVLVVSRDRIPWGKRRNEKGEGEWPRWEMESSVEPRELVGSYYPPVELPVERK